ncbi:putative N-acetyltransferase YhbS [Enterococcus sp. PF1-24]|uniref:GNAT family N-acetyltransferase n=1 Tax=unclassified Enterococcus TaxID=2608891 RepID=UPI00247533A8|nr:MULTISPECIES: GNAT family N-acetyltransferase [unclassified Enterococcus]MDH6364263.1 putative N-acetyltransferase YhbS [Enterococcus sp. PFB1-1]MDH6401378.1 putative N-acetyltransferase YhbS [Enterococcus sp. PF1-24]
MKIQIATQYSKEHFEAITLREEILGSVVDLEKEDKVTIFVAKEKNQVVGTAAVQVYPFGIARVRQVVVAPAFQGKQIGNQLMDSCEQFAREQRCSRVVLTGRKSASPFYLKREYQTFLVPFKKHDIDFFWLSKKVSEPEYQVNGGIVDERSY